MVMLRYSYQTMCCIDVTKGTLLEVELCCMFMSYILQSVPCTPLNDLNMYSVQLVLGTMTRCL